LLAPNSSAKFGINRNEADMAMLDNSAITFDFMVNNIKASRLKTFLKTSVMGQEI